MQSVSYTLDDVVEINQDYPDTYPIPSAAVRKDLKKGQLVKLVFRIVQGDEVDVERMWVIVEGKHKDDYVGVLDSDPYCTDQIKSGMKVRFQVRHVLQIYIAA